VSFIDFAELKASMTIEEAAQLLDMQMHIRGDQFRCACPVCGGGERTLVITPSKGVYFCFKDGKGGDLIALAAHVRQESVRDAAAFLSGTINAKKSTSTSTVRTSSPVPEESANQPRKKLETLSNLEHDHPAIEAIGLDTAVATKYRIGFRTKGAGQGSVMVPVVNPQTGEIDGWLGAQEFTYIPKNFQHESNVVEFKKKA
jgi:phage/plasmid primase-like uncharacterized protein